MATSTKTLRQQMYASKISNHDLLDLIILHLDDDNADIQRPPRTSMCALPPNNVLKDLTLTIPIRAQSVLNALRTWRLDRGVFLKTGFCLFRNEDVIPPQVAYTQLTRRTPAKQGVEHQALFGQHSAYFTQPRIACLVHGVHVMPFHGCERNRLERFHEQARKFKKIQYVLDGSPVCIDTLNSVVGLNIKYDICENFRTKEFGDGSVLHKLRREIAICHNRAPGTPLRPVIVKWAQEESNLLGTSPPEPIHNPWVLSATIDGREDYPHISDLLDMALLYEIELRRRDRANLVNADIQWALHNTAGSSQPITPPYEPVVLKGLGANIQEKAYTCENKWEKIHFRQLGSKSWRVHRKRIPNMLGEDIAQTRPSRLQPSLQHSRESAFHGSVRLWCSSNRHSKD